jgi:hypothetical protein
MQNFKPFPFDQDYQYLTIFGHTTKVTNQKQHDALMRLCTKYPIRGQLLINSLQYIN